MVAMIAEQRPGDAYDEDLLRKENTLLWEANTHLQQRLAEQDKEVVYLRNQVDFHRDWRKQEDRIPTHVLTSGEKATVAAIYGTIRSGEITPNADGYYLIEPWRTAEKSGQSTGTVRGHINYVSDVHEDGKPDKLAAVPLFDKRLVKIPDELREGEFIEATYLKPLEPVRYPLDYEHVARQLHNIGGAGRGQGRKPKCEQCGRDMQEKEHIIDRQRYTLCPRCHITHVYPVEHINDALPATDDFPPDDGGNQVDFSEADKEDFEAWCESMPPIEQEEAENQLDFQHEDAEDRNQPDTVNPSSLPNQVDCEQAEQETEYPVTHPPPMPAYRLNGFSLEDWLQKRIGHDEIIHATGSVDDKKRPKYLPIRVNRIVYDLAAYIRGDLQHIYGSRPALPDGTTYLLGFDCDTPELDGGHLAWMELLAAAGIPSVYWKRRPGRGHLEVYVDHPVDRKAFYAHLVDVCPGLMAVPEVFPIGSDQNTGGVDRADFPYSWPLWYRNGNHVHECTAEVMFPGDQVPMISTGIASDRERLTWLISQVIIPAALIPERIVTQATDQATASRGSLLDTRLPKYSSCNGDGLGKVVIADFNDTHTWEEIAALCGGLYRDRFCSPAHKEDTPSVVIKGNYASDYGRTPSGRVETRDKFGWWCLATGVNQDEELKRRIAERQEVHA